MKLRIKSGFEEICILNRYCYYFEVLCETRCFNIFEFYCYCN